MRKMTGISQQLYPDSETMVVMVIADGTRLRSPDGTPEGGGVPQCFGLDDWPGLVQGASFFRFLFIFAVGAPLFALFGSE
jgi:hypothetical protein